jgi:hypothetical protein
MSAEHVAQMNTLLAASADVAAACSKLDDDYRLVYRLSDGPDGNEVVWEMAFLRSGIVFTLDKPTGEPHLTLRADWRANILATQAARRGETVPYDVEIDGDPTLLDRVGAAREAAGRAATLDVVFPVVP